MKNRCYIYRHRRLDNNEIFYVGKGTTRLSSLKSVFSESKYRRAFSKKNRSQWWLNIVNKYDYVVEILIENLTNEDACELEILLISEYGRRDLGTGCLVNLTDGGEGSTNYVVSDVTRKKQSTKKKGKKLSQNHKNKIRDKFIGLRVGNKHPMWGKVGSLKGAIFTQEHRDKISKSRIKRGLSKLRKNPRAKKVINKNTKKVFGCAKEVSVMENIKYTTFIAMLKNYNPNKTEYLYLKDYKNGE